MIASEEDFLELLIANQRILEWIDQLKGPQKSLQRRKHIIMQLNATVNDKATYAEEALRSGAVQVLTGILRTTDDEEVMDAISSIICACQGPQASGGKVSDFTYGSITVRIREGALGDGLGAKVWSVAHMLCRLLAEHPAFVRGRDVLEIGSGCGVCGILAAKLGASRVDLTDVEGPVLRNLRECVHLNSSDSNTAAREPQSEALSQNKGSPLPQNSTSPKSAHPPLQQPSPQPPSQQAHALPCDVDLFDEADSVDEDAGLGSLFISETGGCIAKESKGTGGVVTEGSEGTDNMGSLDQTTQKKSWEAGNMRVRLLDWLESLQWQQQQWEREGGTQHLNARQHGAEQQFEPLDPKKFYANDILRMEDNSPLQGEVPPSFDPHVRFPRIIGTDIMYEPMHATLVAAVLAHRLEPGGCALVCCAVRQTRTFVAFQAACASQDLRYRWLQVEPGLQEQEGIGGRRCEYDKYEGGFLLMAIDHKSRPCLDVGWGVPPDFLARFTEAPAEAAKFSMSG